MATKINPDFYGAENTFISVTGTGITGNVKTCSKNLRTLGYDETYTGGSLDLTASPWGIGESSLSSCMYGMILNNGNNRISINEHFNTKKNNPFFIYENSSGINSQSLGGGEVTASNLRRVCVKSRLDPQVTFTNSEIQSSIAFDSNENIGSSLSGANPVTYYNYNKSRLLADVVYFIRENSYTIEHDYLVNFLLSPDDFSNVEYVVGVLLEGRFEYGTQGQIPTSGNWVNFSPSIGGVENSIPEFYKSCYYGNNEKWVRPDRQLLNLGYWKVSNYWSLTQLNYGSSPISTTESDMQTPKTNFNIADYTNFFGQVSRKNQVFTDVSYHWELKYLWSSSPYTNINDRTELLNGDIMPNAGSIAPFCYLAIDDTTYNKPALAFFYAIIHECCFMGLPVIANRYDSTYDIGQSSWIFLPKFDEHLVTTGEFVRSNNASASDLVNYSWGDVFGVSMPEYDPNYQPPEPTPEDGDSGNLENTTLSQTYFKGSNKYYLVNDATLSNFISTINSMYVNDGDDTQMKLDFKGSNPNDYIVGIYGIPIDLLAATVGDTIHIGPVDTTISAATLDPSWQHQISFGELPIPAFYGDFRDYEPYTTIELYIPLCGTVQLDCAEYIGHTVKVDGIFDLQTGELTCRVIRKSELGDTVTHTLNGSIWVEIPVSARDMGSFQNNQHQIKMALIQTGFNQISKTVSRAGTDINSAVHAVQSKGKGGINLNGLNAVTVTGDAIQTGLDTANLMYQLTHTPAPISQTSTASTSVGVMMYNQAKLFIKRCKMLPDYNSAVYAHTIGHACLINTTINDVVSDDNNKLIVCANADLTGITATTAEIQAIQTALSSGIYV